MTDKVESRRPDRRKELLMGIRREAGILDHALEQLAELGEGSYEEAIQIVNLRKSLAELQKVL